MASRLIGAIVGTFKVGTGVKVGQPTFQPDRPKLILKGGAYVVRQLGDLKSVTPGKGKMLLVAEPVSVSHVYSVSMGIPKLTLKGKTYEAKEPYRMRIGTPRITLKAKGYVLNRSAIIVVGKPKLLLKGKTPTKVGKAGLVPLVPTQIYGTPTQPRVGLLVPTAAYPSKLLVPTQVKVI